MILLTGATGYVGGRLLKALESRGRPVRCLARRPEALRSRVAPATEIAPGDVLNEASLASAMQGIDTAYYLIHSMASGPEFEQKDRRAASAFGAAALRAGLRRIIYLGGLGKEGLLSRHLASRQEVGRVLRESGVPVVELRASIIIGSGSLSFEMIRALVDRLPVMVTPRWVSTRAQPIAIEDVIEYLIQALDAQETGVFEIGGLDRASYLDIMKEYARQRGLKRVMIRVPVLTPWLSSLWLGLVTPVYARVGRELIEGVRNETVVADGRALRVFRVRPRGLRQAIARTLAEEDRDFAEIRWSDAFSSPETKRRGWAGVQFGPRIVDSRAVRVPRPPEAAFQKLERLGGDTGWYFGDWLWRIRGFLDLLAGGPGMRRGRRDPELLAAGETVDFWRVEKIERGRLLRLRAEMRLPGRAWLQFEVTGDESGSTIRQTAIFDPLGFSGRLYWYALSPVHGLVFAGMLKGITRQTA